MFASLSGLWLIVRSFSYLQPPLIMLSVSIDSQEAKVFDLMGFSESYKPEECIAFRRSGAGRNLLSMSRYVHSRKIAQFCDRHFPLSSTNSFCEEGRRTSVTGRRKNFFQGLKNRFRRLFLSADKPRLPLT
jgi:hypothetical protein